METHWIDSSKRKSALAADDVPYEKQFDGPWRGNKDGKPPFGARECPDVMRK